MKISATAAYCILDVVGGSILTKNGNITIPFLLEMPEAYSLDASEIEDRHREFFRAFQYIRYGFIHKQDIFLRRKFIPDHVIKGDSYIQKAERAHFKDREYLHHFCILSFTLSGLQSLDKSYQENPLSYKENLTKGDKDKLSDFLDNIESACSIIRNIKDTNITPLNVADIKRHIFRYVNGFHNDEGLRDIQFSDRLRIGSKEGVLYAVCDEKYLPERLKTHITDITLQDANSHLYMAMLEKLGIHLQCTHVINQIWQFAGNSYREELSNRVKEFGRWQGFDKVLAKRHEDLTKYESEILNEENVLCRTHFNVMLLEDDEKILSKCSDQVKGIFTNAGFKYYVPSYESLYNMRSSIN